MRYISLLIAFLLFIVSCSNDTNPKQKKAIDPSTEEKLIWANQRMVRVENDLIDNYCKRHNLHLTKTSTGLRYQIYMQGSGPFPKSKQTVSLNYKLKLINGNEVYNSNRDGIKEFVVGKSQEPSGLDEGVRMLKKGGKALFIMPSNLGYGLMGDNYRIPKKAILIYEIELINIK